MIDLLSEDVVTLPEAAKLLPRRRLGKLTHPNTLKNWGRVGFRGVFLETLVVGNTTCTSLQALQRFADNLTRAAYGQRDLPGDNVGSSKSEQRIEHELESRGI